MLELARHIINYKYKSPPPADLFLNYFTFFSISACLHITKLKLCHHLQSSMATKIGLAHQYSFYSTIKKESTISILSITGHMIS